MRLSSYVGLSAFCRVRSAHVGIVFAARDKVDRTVDRDGNT